MARRRRSEPPLEMDPARMAGVLERLGPALGAYAASPPSTFHLGPTREETASLAGRLAPLAKALRGTGVKDLLGVGVAVEQGGRSTRWLSEFLPRLHAARESRLQRVLGPGKLEVLRRYLSLPGGDLLGVLGRERSENAHSDLLRWLMDPVSAPSVAPCLLRKLIDRLEPRDGWRERLERGLAARSITVRREVYLGVEMGSIEAKDRVDLLVASTDFLLAIENKVGTQEHDDQTETYADWLESAPPDVLKGGLFLTVGGERAASARFKGVVYMDVLDGLLEAPLRGALGPIEEWVLSGYVKTLGDHVLREEIGSSRLREAR